MGAVKAVPARFGVVVVVAPSLPRRVGTPAALVSALGWSSTMPPGFGPLDAALRPVGVPAAPLVTPARVGGVGAVAGAGCPRLASAAHRKR